MTCVVTDLGVLEPDESGELTLTELHPDVGVEQAREATGWPLRVAESLRSSRAPTSAELEALRALKPAKGRLRPDEQPPPHRAGADPGHGRRPAPPYLYPDYRSTVPRSPRKPLLLLPRTLSELTGPVYGHDTVGELDHDLTRQHAGEPLGERIIVTGRVTDRDGRPVRSALIEIWQANAAGRYMHDGDQHPAPLDPNFTGAAASRTTTAATASPA